MQLLYFISVWLHILAATAWVGGMFFLILVVVPWLRQGKQHEGAAFLSDTGRRFRNVGWVCFAVFLMTGTFNLWVRGVRLASFSDPAWLASPFGHAVTLKLSGFALVVLLSGVHDFVVGPRATAVMQRAPRSPQAEAMRRRASWMGRMSALLALGMVALGVAIVRGLPW